jgi:hypothetical protein
MSAAREYDSVRTTTDIVSDDGRTIPAGVRGRSSTPSPTGPAWPNSPSRRRPPTPTATSSRPFSPKASTRSSALDHGGTSAANHASNVVLTRASQRYVPSRKVWPIRGDSCR